MRSQARTRTARTRTITNTTRSPAPSAGSSRSQRHRRSGARPGRGRARGAAKTVPRSVAHVSAAPLLVDVRLRTATRASSPMRPGRTAFANRPTPNAENTARNGGSAAEAPARSPGSSAPARASTERRLSAIAATTHPRRRTGTRRRRGPIRAVPDEERDHRPRTRRARARPGPLRLQQLRHLYAANASRRLDDPS